MARCCLLLVCSEHGVRACGLWAERLLQERLANLTELRERLLQGELRERQALFDQMAAAVTDHRTRMLHQPAAAAARAASSNSVPKRPAVSAVGKAGAGAVAAAAGGALPARRAAERLEFKRAAVR